MTQRRARRMRDQDHEDARRLSLGSLAWILTMFGLIVLLALFMLAHKHEERDTSPLSVRKGRSLLRGKTTRRASAVEDAEVFGMVRVTFHNPVHGSSVSLLFHADGKRSLPCDLNVNLPILI